MGQRRHCLRAPKRRAHRRDAHIECGHREPPYDAYDNEEMLAFRHEIHLATRPDDLHLSARQEGRHDDQENLQEHRDQADVHPRRGVAWKIDAGPVSCDLRAHEEDAKHRGEIHGGGRELHDLEGVRGLDACPPRSLGALLVAKHVEHEVHREVYNGENEGTNGARSHWRPAHGRAHTRRLFHEKDARERDGQGEIHQCRRHVAQGAPTPCHPKILRLFPNCEVWPSARARSGPRSLHQEPLPENEARCLDTKCGCATADGALEPRRRQVVLERRPPCQGVRALAHREKHDAEHGREVDALTGR
mmetsp:Transcript_112507/g.317772  ORF Transcript_112507/g.317772 Transcript_112507/m.317772 type:complete len:304 (-) Transcript_112507:294-1205(-)